MDIHPLASKLKITAEQKILILNAPAGFMKSFKPLPGNTKIDEVNKTGSAAYDMVVLFTLNSAELKQFGDAAIKSLKKNGALWIAYPKKSSGIKSDLTRDEGWEFLDPYQLRGVSNIAFDDTWSGLRFKTDPDGKTHNERMTEYKENKKNPEARTVVVPDDFQAALDANPMALMIFNKFAFTHRKEYVRWIESAKKQETREGRIQKAIERIAEGVKFS